jgi:hypothetical protein
MYTQRITLHPVAGKVGEVEAIITERIKRRQAQGTDASLSQRLTGVGATFTLGLRFADLAAFQSFRTANRADTELQAYQAKLAPMLLGPGSVELLEVLIPAAAGPTPKYLQRVTIYPTLDKVGEVTELLKERITAAAAHGDRAGLSRPVVSDHGPSFEANILHEALSAFERTTRANEADKDFQKFVGKLRELIGHPSKTELFEILVPFTS